MAKRKGRQTRRATEKLRVAGSQSSINGGGEVVLYEAPHGQIRLDVRSERDTVWLTQAQMEELFGRERSALPKHIGGAFWGKEPNAKSLCAKFAHTAEASWRTATGSKPTSRNPSSKMLLGHGRQPRLRRQSPAGDRTGGTSR